MPCSFCNSSRAPEPTQTPATVLGHGGRVLPEVTVDTCNEELRDEEGFVGDRASGQSFRAILDDIHERGACVVASTHYGELKAYAYETTGFENASMEFDAKSLRPTYRLRMGTPGASQALKIAERLGLPGPVVERARGNLSEQHRDVAVILATGGMGLVRSAYSAGKPAYGVGPGNAPCYIERTADVAKAARDILLGKTFDNGVLCSSPNSVVVDAAVAQEARRAFEAQGAHFVNGAEADALARTLVTPQRLPNPALVGKSAAEIAKAAGITVPPGVRALIAPLLGRSLSQGHGASVIAIEDLGECGTVKVTRFKRHEVRGCKSSE